MSELAKMGKEKVDSEEIPFTDENIEKESLEQEQEQGNGILDRIDLFAQTGEGAISDYTDHPLNFDNSEAMAQIIRGATGIFDTLDYALIDIAVGTFKFTKSAKDKGVQEDV